MKRILIPLLLFVISASSTLATPSPRTHLREAYLHIAQTEFSDAETLLLHVRKHFDEIDPSWLDAWQHLQTSRTLAVRQQWNATQTAISRQDLLATWDALRQLLFWQPNHAEGLHLYRKILPDLQKRVSDNLQQMEQALSRHDFPSARCALADAHNLFSDHPQVIAQNERLLSQSTIYQQQHMEIMNRAVASNALGRAASIATQLIANFPDDPRYREIQQRLLLEHEKNHTTARSFWNDTRWTASFGPRLDLDEAIWSNFRIDLDVQIPPSPNDSLQIRIRIIENAYQNKETGDSSVHNTWRSSWHLPGDMMESGTRRTHSLSGRFPVRQDKFPAEIQQSFHTHEVVLHTDAALTVIYKGKRSSNGTLPVWQFRIFPNWKGNEVTLELISSNPLVSGLPKRIQLTRHST